MPECPASRTRVDHRLRIIGKLGRKRNRASGRRPADAFVGAAQPRAKPFGGRFRRRAVERHQRRGHAGEAGDVRPPAIAANWRDLDGVGTPGYQFVKSVDDSAHGSRDARLWMIGSRHCGVLAPGQSSEGRDESACTGQRSPALGEKPGAEYFRLSENPQEMHRSSTGFPQGVRSALKTVRTCLTIPRPGRRLKHP